MDTFGIWIIGVIIKVLGLILIGVSIQPENWTGVTVGLVLATAGLAVTFVAIITEIF